MKHFRGMHGLRGGGRSGRRRHMLQDRVGWKSRRNSNKQASTNTSILLIPMPDAIRDEATKNGIHLDQIKLSMTGDILPNGRFGNVWIIMDDGKLLIVNGGKDNKHASIIHDLMLSDIRKLKVANGISTAVIEATHLGAQKRLFRISNARFKEFAEALRLANAWIEKKEWNPESVKLKQSVCEKCGGPLPDNMTVCPACIDKGAMLGKVLSFVKPHRLIVLRLMFLMLLGTLLGLVGPYLRKILVDDVLVPLQNGQLLPWLAGVMILLIAGQSYIDRFTRTDSARIGTRAVYDVRAKLFSHLQEMSLSFYSKHQAGGLVTRVNQDTMQMQGLLVDFIPYGISSILMALGVMVVLICFSPIMTFCVLLPIACMILMTIVVFPRFQVYYSRVFESRSRLGAFVENVISGFRVVKAFAQEKAEVRRFDIHSSLFRDTSFLASYRMALVVPFLHMLTMVGNPIIWLVGGILVFKGKMTLGQIIAFTGYVGMLFRPVFVLTRLVELIPHSLAAAGRVFEIIETEPEIADSKDTVSMPDIKGRIEFQNVTFAYEAGKPVLHDINVSFNENEMIGLVGHSGAGKSTTINLICRLFEVNQGRILIDGVDIRNIPYDDLRRQMGIVMQEPFLLNGTIAENIAYARPNADTKSIIAAAKAANAHDFVVEKPDGYDTQIQNGGSNLSSGEKQRLAIARAVLCDPKILILDEATASVDLQTEKQIQDAIAHLVKDRTTIAIAHRLSTLRHADRLMVLEKGKVVEMGTHEELLANKEGVYSKLVTLHNDTSGLRAVGG